MEAKFFKWEYWNDVDTMTFIFNPAKFLVDFGVFRKGDEYDWVEMDYEKGLMKAGMNDDSKEVEQLFTLTPV